MKQRDDIIAKMMRKYACTKEKAMSMMIMPDPSLNPEIQMEQLSGGGGGGNLT